MVWRVAAVAVRKSSRRLFALASVPDGTSEVYRDGQTQNPPSIVQSILRPTPAGSPLRFAE
eukprot:scaffold8733_cov191-Skeletonema_dohrnii-CCMP3373.AAC.1